MNDWIIPDWPAPPSVRAIFTTRKGGVSLAPYADLNLGTHVGDDPAAVSANRARVRALLPAEPCWLEQVHGVTVVDAALPAERRADAAFVAVPDVPCVVMVADCLPVIFCNRAGTVVAAAHAGWRGLLDGVLEATLAKMGVPVSDVIAWLGPAIGPDSFAVGPEVRDAFVSRAGDDAGCFRSGTGDRWFADIFGLARARLRRAGLGADAVFGGGVCTVSDPARFFSYRRDGACGRMGAFIWIAGDRSAG
ncbi:peptidoglycan editing factor PgeF [Niveibacterium microcysteis]|uniref:Purine nucleoside phosphorylase n=1 Tax=Niveibacterium microcysteis TaxID=2811415 RepID=A0ABX7M129_9RHOO|nr:peptidoglycan editing factor PgeF [Niveibacterium microcysteis]QSI75477.1 peptidoglycan editing factor PgeF [Niveibacterium microcysteis]